jgi:ribose-phosphate pyrophosphokinase
VRAHVGRALLIGPDEESAQWVERIARLAGAPWAVFRKTRRGDFEVALSRTDIEVPARATPVIVDDIASSARTMMEAVEALRNQGHAAPYCIAVHAIFAGDSYEKLAAAKPAGIVSTNSVAHRSNAIDISRPLAAAIEILMRAN